MGGRYSISRPSEGYTIVGSSSRSRFYTLDGYGYTALCIRCLAGNRVGCFVFVLSFVFCLFTFNVYQLSTDEKKIWGASLLHNLHYHGQQFGYSARSFLVPSTRRIVLGDSPREKLLVDYHLRLQEKDMTSKWTDKKTLVVFWGYVKQLEWQLNQTNGVDGTCNIPCEWTDDRSRAPEATGFVIKAGHRRDKPHLNKPIMAVDWENRMESRRIRANNPVDELPRHQINDELASTYSLIASYELSSHVPVLYKEIAKFAESFKTLNFGQLVSEANKKKPEVFFAISNCNAPIVPNRLNLIESIGKRGIKLAGLGSCLGDAKLRKEIWNDETFENEHVEKKNALTAATNNRRGTPTHLKQLSSRMFAYTPENSYGMDYVTEKVFTALLAGTVPIYMGAPNVRSFLPHPNAIIDISDYDSVGDLANYLRTLISNRTLYVHRHLLWRTQPLSKQFLDIVKLTDQGSPYSFACKVCNCFRGKLGCDNALRYNYDDAHI
uniref:Fucosyltransferase n=1 Tax=Aplanochytrium stocchinoi TaxID=215587 RepID=A0A7S3PEP3_9STRA